MLSLAATSGTQGPVAELQRHHVERELYPLPWRQPRAHISATGFLIQPYRRRITPDSGSCLAIVISSGRNGKHPIAGAIEIVLPAAWTPWAGEFAAPPVPALLLLLKDT